MTTTQQFIEEKVQEHIGAVIKACFHNDGTKKSVTDVIDREIPALIKEMTTLAERVREEERERIQEMADYLRPIRGDERHNKAVLRLQNLHLQALSPTSKEQ